MFKKVKDLKSGDVFLYEGKEQVAIHDFDGGDSLWVTIKQFFIYPNTDATYGYTNACVININENNNVDVIENLMEKYNRKIYSDFIKLGYTKEKATELAKAALIMG